MPAMSAALAAKDKTSWQACSTLATPQPAPMQELRAKAMATKSKPLALGCMTQAVAAGKCPVPDMHVERTHMHTQPTADVQNRSHAPAQGGLLNSGAAQVAAWDCPRQSHKKILLGSVYARSTTWQGNAL
jgi:hypothetical protein